MISVDNMNNGNLNDIFASLFFPCSFLCLKNGLSNFESQFQFVKKEGPEKGQIQNIANDQH